MCCKHSRKLKSDFLNVQKALKISTQPRRLQYRCYVDRPGETEGNFKTITRKNKTMQQKVEYRSTGIESRAGENKFMFMENKNIRKERIVILTGHTSSGMEGHERSHQKSERPILGTYQYSKDGEKEKKTEYEDGIAIAGRIEAQIFPRTTRVGNEQNGPKAKSFVHLRVSFESKFRPLFVPQEERTTTPKYCR